MKIASAPVSYGVFGDLTVDEVLSVDEVLQNMAQAGFTGSEFGPPRFFGAPAEAAARFANANLAAVGVYVPLHTQDDGAVLERDLERMRMSFEELQAAGGNPLIILADEGDPNLLLNPRKPADLVLQGAAWNRLVHVVNQAAAEARSLGFEVSFHPHISTYVELPSEVEKLLNDTDLDLTYDIGHMVLAGGDGVELFERWRERINHVHIKDVDRSVLENAREQRREDFDDWWSRVSVRLGTGDARLTEFVAAIKATGYDRWIVIEHDSAPLTKTNVEQVLADQKANADWLIEQLSAH